MNIKNDVLFGINLILFGFKSETFKMLLFGSLAVICYNIHCHSVLSRHVLLDCTFVKTVKRAYIGLSSVILINFIIQIFEKYMKFLFL